MNFYEEKKKMIWVVIGILLLISSVIVYLIIDKEGVSIKNSIKYTTEFIIQEDEKTYEVKLEQSSNNTWLFVDGERDELLSIIPHTPLPIMSLPKTSKLLDVTTEEPISELTWNSSLEESQSYLNYLEQEGYRKLRQVQSADFIEVILQKEDTKKRVIIFESSIMVGELNKDVELTSLEDYIKKYRTLGGKKDVK